MRGFLRKVNALSEHMDVRVHTGIIYLPSNTKRESSIIKLWRMGQLPVVGKTRRQAPGLISFRTGIFLRRPGSCQNGQCRLMRLPT